jgi:cyclopropane fatty-acyl-phospholipid synthase-like methyltransferase
MNFRTFFSEQARNPSGIFGRWIMSRIFDYGNAVLNDLMLELLTLQQDDHVLEIGFGTGKLLNAMARQTSRGLVEGIDLSSTMFDLAQNKNKQYIAQGRVKIVLGDFDQAEYRDNDFDKICSANTLYFWTDAGYTVKKIHRTLRPGGKLFLGFEDKAQLEKRPISEFNIYAEEEIEQLLTSAGFAEVETRSKRASSDIVHCVVAVKKTPGKDAPTSGAPAKKGEQ